MMAALLRHRGGFVTSESAPLIVAVFPVSVSRFSRCRSVRISEACWYRRLRSFSRLLWMISSSFCGMSGFKRTADVAVPSSMALKINAEVSPRNGKVPVEFVLSFGVGRVCRFALLAYLASVFGRRFVASAWSAHTLVLGAAFGGVLVCIGLLAWLVFWRVEEEKNAMEASVLNGSTSRFVYHIMNHRSPLR
jgi:hypothetical protein